ncbi:MAG: peptidase [Candidatus Poribacteria bacterium]|nr:MAG: peptidase [Candidatus Poribacteria bacterium]
MRRKTVFRGFSLLLVAWLTIAGKATTMRVTYYVSPEGKDEWSGLLVQPNRRGTDGPFASLERARDAVRELKRSKGLPEGGVQILVLPGTYVLAQPLELSEEDSGTPEAPIVYQAFPGGEVRITGGSVVRGFTPVRSAALKQLLSPEARDQVMIADLSAQGIYDYGELTPRGFGRPIQPAALELFFKNRPMPLARYPNEGWLTIAGAPKGPNGGQFTYKDERPQRWKQREGIWVHGYWTHDWADSYEAVAQLDPWIGLVQTEPPHGVYGYKPGQRFRFLNVLDELDEPGEWYLDRGTGLLFFWPPEPIGYGDVVVSMTRTLVRAQELAHVVFAGFIFEACRGDAFVLEGGHHCLIAGATFRNIGNRAVVIQGGYRHGIRSCDILDTGDGGISLSGGDRKTLEPGGHYVENCEIARYSRWCRTYRPAVGVSGVGHRVAHCRIHDAPHTGILFGGNDHLLEYNEVFNICQETGDVGAFYTGRDWTTRGTVIRYNFFHDIHGPYTHGAMSVYLDDCASGTIVFGNIFYRASRAVFIGGGRDNLVENNLFIECDPAVHIDARGLTWAAQYMAPGSSWRIFEKLEAVQHDRPPYSTRYPRLATILEDDPPVPKGNRIVRNVSVQSRWLELAQEAEPFTEISDNLVDPETLLFRDPERLDFTLRPDAPVWRLGFQPIPAWRIGLIHDGVRLTLPPR